MRDAEYVAAPRPCYSCSAEPVTGTTTPSGTYSISGVPVNPAGAPYTITASKTNYVATGTTTATPVAGTTVSASSTTGSKCHFSGVFRLYRTYLPTQKP